MQTIGYTDSDRIRAVCGITEEDLDDTQLLARGLDKELNIDLLSWFPTAADIAATGTDTQLDSLILYSTYFCAHLASQSLRMAATQKITDGANALDRFANIDWDAMQSQLKERAAFYKQFIVTSVGATVAVSFSMFSGVGLLVDPVTGS